MNSKLTKVFELVTEVIERNPDNNSETFSVSENRGIIPQRLLFKKQIAKDDRSKYRCINYGDVIYNPYLLWNGAVGVCFSREGGCVSPAYVVLRPFHKGTERFLHYFFRSPMFVAEVDAIATGTVTRRRTAPLSDILNLSFSLPNLNLQRATNEILELLDEKSALNSQMNTTLESMAQTLFKSWFVDFDPVIDNALATGNSIPEPLHARAETRKALGDKSKSLPEAMKKQFPSCFIFNEEMGWIPDGWKVGLISHLCVKVQNGGTPKRDNLEYWDNGTIPWLTSGEVRQTIVSKTVNKITELGLKNSSAKWLPSGASVVAMYGATAGQVAFVSSPLTTNQAVCGLIPKEPYKYFNYLALERIVASLAKKARGSAQQNISKGIIEETRTIVPPETLVKQFSDQVESLFNRWIHNLLAQESLAELRDTLLPKLLSGQLSIPDIKNLVVDAE